MTHPLSTMHVAWPARQFYWAKLDASELFAQGALSLRRRPSTTQLSYLFENVLPLPVDQLQVAFAAIRTQPAVGGHTYLACGIQRTRLREELDPAAITLMPRDLHEVQILVAIGDVDAASFNLLQGEFQPPRITRMRRRMAIEVAVALLLISALVTFGMLRRADSLGQGARAWQSAQAAILDQVLGADSRSSSQPQQLQLIVELRRLRQTRRVDVSSLHLESPSAVDADVTKSLVDLLQRWPETNALTQSLSIAPAGILIRASLPDADQVQALIGGLEPLEGWELQQPAIRAGQEGFDLELRFEKVPSGSQSLSTVSQVRP